MDVMTLLPLALLLCAVIFVISLVRRRNRMDVAGARSEFLAREAGTFPSSDANDAYDPRAYAALPAEERMERILQQILAEQKRANSRLTGVGWGVAILFLWIVVIPFVIGLFLSR